MIVTFIPILINIIIYIHVNVSCFGIILFMSIVRKSGILKLFYKTNNYYCYAN